MATHSSMLARRIPWTEEPGGPQSMGIPKSQTQLSALWQMKKLRLRENDLAKVTHTARRTSVSRGTQVCRMLSPMLFDLASSSGEVGWAGRFGSVTEQHWSLSPRRPHTRKNQDPRSSERSQGHEL